jgi:hypothetical protein
MALASIMSGDSAHSSGEATGKAYSSNAPYPVIKYILRDNARTLRVSSESIISYNTSCETLRVS